MRRNFRLAGQVVTFIVVCVMAGFGAAPDETTPPSLKEQLKAQYKLTKTSIRSGGLAIVEPGTVLVLQQDGAPAVPPTSALLAVAVVKDGELHPPGTGSRMMFGKDMRILQKGEKVYVTKISVNLKADRIGLTVIECDTCNGATHTSSYRSVIDFQFAKGSLQTTSVPDVEDMIAKVFTIDAPQTEIQPPAPAPQGPPPAQEPPKSIQLGQTIDQVKAILGQPEKTVNLGAKQIFVYKDLKVTFLDGKVSDVQ